ncbi:uncharacterized protein LOC142632355 [Castanea sativa]|uniref:uncharacterized protein LOC142632355 n=1 Tax=Castanea sativa TaxID=21020 RepID=UPI003F64E042
MGASCAEDLVKVKIMPNYKRSFLIGASLKDGEKVELLFFLVQNIDVFAWSLYKVPRVDPKFIVHKLNMDPLHPSKKQRPRRSAKEHVEALRQKVGKLKEAGAIKEAFFPEWLAITVVVKKKNDKWRVFVDFTDLNQACLKDPFPMLKIHQLVDAIYRPRSLVKGQVLVDFIAEFSPKRLEMACHVEVISWKVFVDGASNAVGGGAGIVVITPEGIKLEYSFKLGFKASNNEAKYEALLVRLRVVSDLGAKEVEVYSNSRLSPFVSDNGLRFDSKAFREFCNNLGIRNQYSTLVYPQSNGQAEATNKAIVNGLKKRLEGAKGKWAYRTTLRRSTRETPFSLTFEAEAVIPAEVNLCSARVTGFTPAENEELIFQKLKLLEEHREAATIQLAEYQQKLPRRYNKSVRRREFTVGNLTLQKVVGKT